jgi:hypothetical protein
MKWVISDIDAKDGVITSAKYHVSYSDNDITVETEGYWLFRKVDPKVKFEDVTEEMIGEWIEEDQVIDGRGVIIDRLKEQHEALQTPKTIPPWQPQVFTPKF